jgi:hypothetical protein
MRIIEPASNAVLGKTPEPTWQRFEFRTRRLRDTSLGMEVSWRTFQKSGRTVTSENLWDAGHALSNLGGTLTVRVSSTSFATRSEEPTRRPSWAKQYLMTQLNGAGVESSFISYPGPPWVRPRPVDGTRGVRAGSPTRAPAFHVVVRHAVVSGSADRQVPAVRADPLPDRVSLHGHIGEQHSGDTVVKRP